MTYGESPKIVGTPNLVYSDPFLIKIQVKFRAISLRQGLGPILLNILGLVLWFLIEPFLTELLPWVPSVLLLDPYLFTVFFKDLLCL